MLKASNVASHHSRELKSWFIYWNPPDAYDGGAPPVAPSSLSPLLKLPKVEVPGIGPPTTDPYFLGCEPSTVPAFDCELVASGFRPCNDHHGDRECASNRFRRNYTFALPEHAQLTIESANVTLTWRHASRDAHDHIATRCCTAGQNQTGNDSCGIPHLRPFFALLMHLLNALTFAFTTVNSCRMV